MSMSVDQSKADEARSILNAMFASADRWRAGEISEAENKNAQERGSEEISLILSRKIETDAAKQCGLCCGTGVTRNWGEAIWLPLMRGSNLHCGFCKGTGREPLA